MRNIYLLLFISFFPFFFSSCSSDEELDKKEFSINETYLTQQFDNKKQDISISVNTTLSSDDWSVVSDQSWCLVTKNSDGKSIRLYITESQEPDIRTAAVSVKSTVKNYEIKVTQLGYGKAVIVDKETRNFTSSSAELTVKVTSNVDYKIVVPNDVDWISPASKTKAMEEKDILFYVKENEYYENRSAEISFVCSSDESVKAVVVVNQAARASSASDVEIAGDIYVKPIGGKASEAQLGQDIDKCYDRSFTENAYHSIWSQSANFPVSLEFFFDGKEQIDYILYHTRSGNGNFGELEIYYTTTEQTDYTLYGSFDFKMQNASSRVVFDGGLKNVTAIKFSVKSGAGDYVSCQEMEFFRKNTDKTLNNQLLTVFQDLSCSSLRSDATQQKINALPGFFAQLATRIKNNEYSDYEKQFRIREYKPYSDVEIWASKLMTNKYSNLDNTTGIYGNEGDTIIVLIGEMYGNNISLQCVADVNASGTMYYLEEGVNKIVLKNTGMFYVMYNTDLTLENAKPVKIHIPMGCGTVNGFFDLKEHKTDAVYADLLSKSTYKYFEVIGDRIMFKFHRAQLNQFVKTEILSAINLWDNIISWQQELMGIDDVRPSQFNNHLQAVSPEDGYMWASDYRIGFINTYLGNILLYDNVMAAKDNAWGPAHEIGHIHQAAINWPSSTESSNNLFSNYTLYKLGKYDSRGSDLAYLAECRFANKQAWFNMGDATHQGESTEVHMRMNWQLWNYYHRCGYKPDFWPTLFKLLRENRIVEKNPGEGQLKFAMMASKAANQNLTEFFELWGFFEPVNNVSYDQYGTWNYNVTASMIAEAKAYMAKFPAPKHAFQYIEDRKSGELGLDITAPETGYYTQFKDNVKITKSITYTRSGQTFSVKNGSEAVAFELVIGSQLIYFSNMFEFTVPETVSTAGAVLYAVQADGTRIVISKE
ncbi:MAG: M60 family metallopeptidase [Bacteroidales bacterium]|nr:M60 family metallopeptidase [Bacteroidales bacterium]